MAGGGGAGQHRRCNGIRIYQIKSFLYNIQHNIHVYIITSFPYGDAVLHSKTQCYF